MREERCENCRWWERGATYTQKAYGHIPDRIAWSAIQTGEYKHQSGECRIVPPWKCGGYFPTTYEFQGCGDFTPTGGGDA